MKRDNINYLLVGLTVLAAFVLLLYALFRMTGGVGNTDAYHVNYRSVGGLHIGTPVSYQGYRLGSVVSIRPERGQGKTRYRVEFQIRTGWRIPVDSVASIYAEGLLAETIINIEEGESADFHEIGAELRGRQGVDMFAALAAIADDVGGLTRDSVRPLLDNLNARINSLGGEMGARLPLILDGLQALVSSLQQSADRLNGVLNPTTEQQVTRVLENTDQMSTNMLQLSKGLLEVQQEAHKLLQDSHGLVKENREDVNAAVTALRRSLEDVAAHADTILQNLDGASRNMNEFSRQIRQNPGLLLGGKAPREQGVGNE